MNEYFILFLPVGCLIGFVISYFITYYENMSIESKYNNEKRVWRITSSYRVHKL